MKKAEIVLMHQKSLTTEIYTILTGTFFLMLGSKFIIPLSPVPITLQTAAIYLIGTSYSPKQAFLSVFSFLTLGAMGCPIFASFLPGNLILVGPTGGYLLGMLIAAPIMATLSTSKNSNRGIIFLNLLLGYSIIHLFGLLQLSYFMPFKTAIEVGVMPFIFGECLKMIFVITLKINSKSK